jgi:hypothetical protein
MKRADALKPDCLRESGFMFRTVEGKCVLPDVIEFKDKNEATVTTVRAGELTLNLYEPSRTVKNSQH